MGYSRITGILTLVAMSFAVSLATARVMPNPSAARCEALSSAAYEAVTVFEDEGAMGSDRGDAVYEDTFERCMLNEGLFADLALALGAP